MRALRISLVVLAVLAGLFVAADRIAVHLAEERAAEQVAESEGLTGTESVSVSINGFPFLTQALGRELDEVDVELTGMTAEARGRRITVTEVDAQLSHVRIGENFSSATAEQATGTARISYEDLTASAPTGVKVSYAGADRAARNQVRLTASVQLLGQTVKIPRPFYSSVRLEGGDRVKLRAEEIPLGGIPGAEDRVRGLVDFGSTVHGLPEGLDLAEAEVTKEGVTFALEGQDVRLAG
ncbi:DUF2993 domain-containing protein [Streptomyces sp. JJ36]|uniref:LmeA family phospholipid-binding protein n=1 Tax=Streptomyces sp. JJ36 TaxID=2736645 RepID=UPI001F33FDA9|nr:DUF2993 domain-containing protein [Streptomyces sp. JJ36]MCF6524160.1 DUF2993 domain-containing protein [Streptomyces sp. JJ36]